MGCVKEQSGWGVGKVWVWCRRGVGVVQAKVYRCGKSGSIFLVQVE